MKKLIILVVAFTLSASFAYAEGNAEAGQTKSAACAGCHGVDGNNGGGFPKLAGQNVWTNGDITYQQSSADPADLEVLEGGAPGRPGPGRPDELRGRPVVVPPS